MNESSKAVTWFPSGQRKLFRIFPFQAIEKDVDRDVYPVAGRKGRSPRVLVAAFSGRGVVRRSGATGDALAKEASDLARLTGNPVIIGRQVGIDGEGMPIWEAVGKIVTAKADPLSSEAFDSWALSMAEDVMSVSSDDLAAMATSALEYLDIDFMGASVQEIERALLGYRTTIASPTARMMSVQQLEITRALQPILRQTSAAAQNMPQIRAGLGAGFTVRDKEVSRLLAQHHTFWVRDQHGNISRELSERARRIVASGSERGLGNREIGAELKALTRDGLQMPGYWNTVAANFVARARTYSLGASYRAAGIEYYRIEAVLDDRTTHQCLFLHGKILPTDRAMARIDRTLGDDNPESVLWNQPFMSDNGDNISVDYPDGTSRRVADIVVRSSGASPSGHSAQFSNPISTSEMVDAAIGFPPYHFGCRTTTVPA